jgi:excisionase family DNA binding protein
MAPEAPKFLRISQFAKETSLSRASTYHLIANGKIPAVRIGGALRIPSDFLDELKRRAFAGLQDVRLA